MASEGAPVAPSPRRQRYLPAEPDEAAALMYKSFTDADMKPLARELSSHKTLKTLDLRMNLITDTGVDFLASGIEDAHACALVTLNLNGNAITDAGAHRLAAMLRKNTTIQHLGLSANKITDAGASALFHALASHHAFARVSLQGNDIFSEDILDRADALLHSPAPLLRGMYEMGHRSHFNKAGREDSMRRKDSRRATLGRRGTMALGPAPASVLEMAGGGTSHAGGGGGGMHQRRGTLARRGTMSHMGMAAPSPAPTFALPTPRGVPQPPQQQPQSTNTPKPRRMTIKLPDLPQQSPAGRGV